MQAAMTLQQVSQYLHYRRALIGHLIHSISYGGVHNQPVPQKSDIHGSGARCIGPWSLVGLFLGDGFPQELHLTIIRIRVFRH